MKRVFVFGRERSGTKWLTNLIANHESMACVQAEHHCGVLETNMFGRMEKVFGDLANADNRSAFNQCFSRTDFFRLTDLPFEYLANLQTNDYSQVFTEVMDEFARRHNATGWVQKVNSVYAERIANEIPGARLICIQRDPVDNLLSKTLRRPENESLRNTLQHMFGYVYSQKIEDQFCREHSAFKVRFESLKNDPAVTIQSVCEFLDLEYSAAMLENRFQPNTTFSNKKRPELSASKRKKLHKIHRWISAIPFPVLQGIRRLLGQGNRQANRFAKGTFDMEHHTNPGDEG